MHDRSRAFVLQLGVALLVADDATASALVSLPAEALHDGLGAGMTAQTPETCAWTTHTYVEWVESSVLAKFATGVFDLGVQVVALTRYSRIENSGS